MYMILFVCRGNSLYTSGQKDERLATAPHRVHVIAEVGGRIKACSMQ